MAEIHSSANKFTKTARWFSALPYEFFKKNHEKDPSFCTANVLLTWRGFLRSAAKALLCFV